eukprot:scaffold317343_cov31-Prasinocladus_malaysianus.AAC.2
MYAWKPQGLPAGCQSGPPGQTWSGLRREPKRLSRAQLPLSRPQAACPWPQRSHYPSPCWLAHPQDDFSGTRIPVSDTQARPAGCMPWPPGPWSCAQPF